MGHAEPGNTPASTTLRRLPPLVSFSGIDGAGKTTQIGFLYRRLSEAGVHVRLLTFWDDVVVLRRAREFLSHALFRGEKGVGSPGKPVLRRDKNVLSWYMTPARFVLYLLDALSLTAVVAKLSATTDADVVIFDRYLYDEFANLNLSNRVSRAYVRLLLQFIPRPDLACLLDADPSRAHERKPEYGLEFVCGNRASYLALSTFAGGITVISPLPAEEVTRRILQQLSEKLPGNPGMVSRDLLTSM